MAFRAEGYVERISQKEVQTRRGASLTYSFLLDDSKWYRTNFTKPEFGAGDFVQFEYSEGKYGNDVDMDSLEVTETGEKPKPQPKKSPDRPAFNKPAGAKTAGTQVGGNKDAYWEAKEKRDIEKDIVIRYLSSRNAAIAFVEMLVKAGAVPIGATKASKATSVELIEELVDKYTNELFLNSTFDKVSSIKPVKASKPVKDFTEEELEEQAELANGEDGDD